MLSVWLSLFGEDSLEVWCDRGVCRAFRFGLVQLSVALSLAIVHIDDLGIVETCRRRVW